MKTTYTYNIGVEATMEVIGGKWKPIILCNLRHQKMRTNELKKAIPGITQKMLTQQLRELERDQIVNRIVYSQVPPKVEYELSAYGLTLSTILDQLCSWGEIRVQKLAEEGNDVTLLSKSDCPEIN
ncbi:winged helix-turn-helix transcriptional regulator [Carnobacterium divergens]|uniref:winged helix-turn-helix transcriptional regulator n=1 Tax=Carnobacterium divergens TaxID=2748 RepID=UPI0010729F73|nr:helix-turn-helix domain-containing protein [Carnobacterium divergens]TFI72101.1 MarR family transcriptional regulator [Carnobacterium divergens]